MRGVGTGRRNGQSNPLLPALGASSFCGTSCAYGNWKRPFVRFLEGLVSHSRISSSVVWAKKKGGPVWAARRDARSKPHAIRRAKLHRAPVRGGVSETSFGKPARHRDTSYCRPPHSTRARLWLPAPQREGEDQHQNRPDPRRGNPRPDADPCGVALHERQPGQPGGNCQRNIGAKEQAKVDE